MGTPHKNEKFKSNGKLRRRYYEQEKGLLQVELLKLQHWVKSTNAKVLAIFEGRDAAGKGGTIKRIIEHINPRGCRVVALDKPSETEKTQWYFQRYIPHLPSGGEIVLMDRSWYNRAGVERVMGFCTVEEYEKFYEQAPQFEQMLVESGIFLLKYWFSVSPEEQTRRFTNRTVDPLRQWKLSPVDKESTNKWDAYTAAKEAMFLHTDTVYAPWTVVKSDDKKRARLNCIRHMLNTIPYTGKDVPLIRSFEPEFVGAVSEMIPELFASEDDSEASS
ncbi:MAG: polyphosphate kinase 2 [SAR324 cluster bacterium]|nr:polyphosphate kinase 2 [SAR324 cluster bacterium]